MYVCIYIYIYKYLYIQAKISRNLEASLQTDEFWDCSSVGNALCPCHHFDQSISIWWLRLVVYNPKNLLLTGIITLDLPTIANHQPWQSNNYWLIWLVFCNYHIQIIKRCQLKSVNFNLNAVRNLLCWSKMFQPLQPFKMISSILKSPARLQSPLGALSKLAWATSSGTNLPEIDGTSVLLHGKKENNA